MTEEQKQALIDDLQSEKLVLEKWRDDWNARDKINYQAIDIALAALTQPASPSLKLPWNEKTCRACGSKSLSWGFAIINKSTVQNGLLRTSDVDGLFYLGCDECSETVTQVSPDEAVELLSALQQSINAPHTAPIEPICATGGAEWVKVPREPTRQMMSQGHFAMAGTDRGKFRRIYQAMIAAAPQPE